MKTGRFAHRATAGKANQTPVMGNKSEKLHREGDCIAIIAGRGDLPLEIANAVIEQGKNPFLVGIEGNPNSSIVAFDHVVLRWGQLGNMFKLLQERNTKTAVFAGGVTRPTKLREFKFDWEGICALPKVAGLMLKGDNTLLSGLTGIFATRGIEVVGAHSLLPSLLAESGVIAGKKPDKHQRLSIETAFAACKRLGAADIGQAAVVERGIVIAEEDRWGTDEMLAKVAKMRKNGKLSDSAEDGVLVKTMKPGQDMRVDLPAIGPKTIQRLVEAGLKGVAVEAGRSLILSRAITLEAATTAGVFIFGLEKNTEID